MSDHDPDPEGDLDGPEDDRLLDLLEEWEDRYRRDEDAAPDSFGVDPALMEVLRERIERQKRLYEFMKLSPSEQGRRDAPAPDAVRSDPAPIPSPTDPPSIGRYRIIRVLGEGGFGRVYLAYDSDLQREVAAKVPLAGEAPRFLDVEAYLREARIVARLSHPNIVPVYDVGRIGDGRCYVVSKYMEGGDLKTRLGCGRAAFSESAELVAVICDALQYTHTQDLFHRDIKPANILLDAAGGPSLADFGLALRDEDVGRGAGYLGTAAYMSPEQARGEGHRVDGRSDIFSIGVVLYELLTGRRPFRGSSHLEIMQQVIGAEPRPPRQIDGTIPGELERICLKAMAKRASERYTTARDLADDLRHFLATASWTGGPTADLPPAVAAGRVSREPAPTASDSGSRPIRIVPRGLGSFDEHDADFFLELLPGPRDRDGLPDGLRFWKTRIETADPDRAFRVGLIYGPSGCGKSSMVKAGLLPRLGPQVCAIYVEAAGAETESRMFCGLRRFFPALPADGGLAGALKVLRRGHGLPAGRKVLLVLDQFEQWLFARRDERGDDLVDALRQCDGEHIQALCLVRDDFWMAATRFMKDLDIDLVPERNVAAVDLFEPRHVRRVLAAYGRAYDALPPRSGELSRDQETFLDQVVAGLAQDGWIVPVRLALFAEMIKGRPWTPAILREVGGMDGVGVKFLEDTFSSPRSNPNHRYHQRAAQAVLKALLPETNADIKGRMRSVDELRKGSGYAERPADFADLIRMLDGELRLITPVDPEGSVDEEVPAHAPGGQYFQLTHDYLVHALRDWLTRKQRETRRGRAELLLAERAILWNSKPEDRYLPTVREWAEIRLLTRVKSWSEPERRMMGRARRRIGLRGMGLAIIAGIVAASVIEIYGAIHVYGLVKSLASADTSRVPGIIREIVDYGRRAQPGLRRILADEPDESGASLHVRLALLAIDDGQIPYLRDRMLGVGPVELKVLRTSLWPYRDRLIGSLWEVMEKGDDKMRLRAAGVLALFDPGPSRWEDVAGPVARAMVLVTPVHLADWRDILRPVADRLEVPLKQILRDEARNEADRVNAASYLIDYVGDSPSVLVDLLMDSDAKVIAVIFPVIEQRRERVIPLLEQAIQAEDGPTTAEEDVKDREAERRARAAVTLVRLGARDAVWPLLAHSPDPRLRSFVIHWFARLGVGQASVLDHLQSIDHHAAGSMRPEGRRLDDSDRHDPNRTYLFDETVSIRRALILTLGQYESARLPSTDREQAIGNLLKLYRDDPDAGVHGAAAWTLRRWQQRDRARAIDVELSRLKQWGRRRWRVNSLGQTMTVVDGPLDFLMGSPETEPGRAEDEGPVHERRIAARFAIGTEEVSVEDFAEFVNEFPALLSRPGLREAGLPRRPQQWIDWYIAAAFCNWLSRKEGLPEVYEPNDKKEYASGMRVKAGHFDLGGYRLPRESEWEYTCRSGTRTSRYYGNSVRLLRSYARLISWEESGPLPCGSLMPNDFGVFDLLGNQAEWCHDRQYDYTDPGGAMDVSSSPEEVLENVPRMMRGGSYNARPPVARSASRYSNTLEGRSAFHGFRPARSCP